MEDLELQFKESSYCFTDKDDRFVVLKRTLCANNSYKYTLLINDVIVNEKRHDQLKCLTNTNAAELKGAYWVFSVIKEMLSTPA